MSLPSEYVIEDAVGSIDDVIVYRANHPIHGTVNVYLPDNTLSPTLAGDVGKRLYQNGLQMRNISLLDVPLVVKALEVSQNPNEPYIVTEYSEHDLEEFISNGVITKPKRMFTILSQTLEAITNLAANGWLIDRIRPRQVKLSELHSGDISFCVIEGTGQQINVADTSVTTDGDRLGDAATTVKITERTNLMEKSQAPVSTSAEHQDVNRTATFDRDVHISNTRKQLMTRQRNIYLLGSIAYQLLFGRKYEPGDKIAAANIRKLAGRWRKILEKAFSQDIDRRYDTYETMLAEVRKATNRNKRIAVASIPFLVLLLAVAGYFAYEQYHKHKIMTSEAGQAIKSFLDIVNETDDEFPELKKPKQPPSTPDDETVLEPFDKIEPVDKD